MAADDDSDDKVDSVDELVETLVEGAVDAVKNPWDWLLRAIGLAPDDK